MLLITYIPMMNNDCQLFDNIDMIIVAVVVISLPFLVATSIVIKFDIASPLIALMLVGTSVRFVLKAKSFLKKSK